MEFSNPSYSIDSQALVARYLPVRSPSFSRKTGSCAVSRTANFRDRRCHRLGLLHDIMANARKTSRTVGRKTRSTKWDRDAANLLEALAAKLRGERIAGRSESCVTPSSPGNASVSCGLGRWRGRNAGERSDVGYYIPRRQTRTLRAFVKGTKRGCSPMRVGSIPKKKGRDQWVEFDGELRLIFADRFLFTTTFV